MNFISALAALTLSIAASTSYAAYSLSPYQVFATGSWAENVAIGDIDGDGRNDVVLTTSFYSDPANDWKVFVFFQKPDGTLATPKKYSFHSNGSYLGLALADLDHDARMEIIVGHGSGISILDWDTSPYRVQKMLSKLHPSEFFLDAGSVAAVDVDRDGALDVVAQSYQSSASIYFGDGHGGVSRQVAFETNTTWHNEVESGDFNGDGYGDIAVVSGADYLPAYVFYNDGSDNFSSPVEIDPSPGYGEISGTLAAGDFTSDGRDDLVVMRNQYGLSLFPQDMDGGFEPLVAIPTADWPGALVGHDLDMDGDKDLIVLHGDGEPGILLNNAGELSAEVLVSGPYGTWFNSQGLAAGDINGDACTDIAYANSNVGLVVYFGNGCNGPGSRLDVRLQQPAH